MEHGMAIPYEVEPFRLSCTSHGKLSVWDGGGSGTPLLLIHGNSSSHQVFARQLRSDLAARCRLITFDLPGHGQSEDAHDPARTYSLPGLADCTVELLERLEVSSAVVLGWSLGGHVAIEMLSRFKGMKGLILTGTPPIRRGGFVEGFVSSPADGLAGRRHLSEAEVDTFAQAMFGTPVEPFLQGAIGRSDGRCRQGLFEASRAGLGVDQRLAVEGSALPIAVINGATDPLIRLDYLEGVAYRNLWEGRCHRLDGAGHAPFWHAADTFNALVGRFLGELERGTAGLERPAVKGDQKTVSTRASRM
ncbi:alpha/beta hydrolase [Belnapia sp. T18]|uniref:Alpha/beta hydrolase n=1 Tax=Belnapia arida TaxID=2804533 RepID=A0ABS1TWQ2_9PROT|nr:alpha/beta hydrolase [Belnapia arida]MBL6076857.1 alpha/beta hydrolase [Belnapia arida]